MLLKEENQKGKFDNISPTPEAWRKIKANKAAARNNEICQFVIKMCHARKRQ